MNKIVKGVRNQLLKRIYNISFLRSLSEVDYHKALEQHLENLPILSSPNENLLETIRREGVAITSLAALSISSSEQLLQTAKNLIPKIPGSISGNKEEFVVHASFNQIMEYPEIFLWGLEEKLLNLAENYIGLPVAYHGAYFRRDIANGVQRKSRLWHIDKEDRKVFKIIVYLNDISHEQGPFQYIPQPFTSELINLLKYNYEYISDQNMEKFISPSDWKSCIGNSGTVIMTDTASIFHRGKIPLASDRFAIFFDYTSRQPKYPFYCKSSLPEEYIVSLAHSLSESQKQCVFWRQNPLTYFNIDAN